MSLYSSTWLLQTRFKYFFFVFVVVVLYFNRTHMPPTMNNYISSYTSIRVYISICNTIIIQRGIQHFYTQGIISRQVCCFSKPNNNLTQYKIRFSIHRQLFVTYTIIHDYSQVYLYIIAYVCIEIYIYIYLLCILRNYCFPL